MRMTPIILPGTYCSGFKRHFNTVTRIVLTASDYSIFPLVTEVLHAFFLICFKSAAGQDDGTCLYYSHSFIFTVDMYGGNFSICLLKFYRRSFVPDFHAVFPCFFAHLFNKYDSFFVCLNRLVAPDSFFTVFFKQLVFIPYELYPLPFHSFNSFI